MIVPSATTTLADMNEWATPFWNELWPYAKIILGIFIAVTLIALIIDIFTGLFDKYFHSKQDDIVEAELARSRRLIAESDRLLRK